MKNNKKGISQNTLLDIFQMKDIGIPALIMIFHFCDIKLVMIE